MSLVKDLDDIHLALTRAWAIAQRAGLGDVLKALDDALRQVDVTKEAKLRPPSPRR